MVDSGRVLIVGGGLSGLTCARILGDAGIPTAVFEASERAGGRLGSDRVDGFTLERGFQVFLTGYPEAKRLLDYGKLNLRTFTPGALIRHGGKFHRLVDPRRKPTELPTAMLSPLASVGDKLRLPIAAGKIAAGGLPHVTTLDRLRGLGLSERIIERFFRPFFAGVFLEKQLATSSKIFDFTFLQFATSDATLPASGMQAIADQLAGSARHSEMHLNQAVGAIEGRTIILRDGQRISGRAVVVATDANAASALLPSVEMPRSQNWTGTTCVYFAADRSPVGEPILVLNAEADGPVNNVAVISDASPEHAPPGQALIACTVIGVAGDNEPAVRKQMSQWYGNDVDTWRHLKTYRIPYALPDKSVAAMNDPYRKPNIGDGIYLCGDHCDFSSINGAMASGRRAAEAILRIGVAAD